MHRLCYCSNDHNSGCSVDKLASITLSLTVYRAPQQGQSCLHALPPVRSSTLLPSPHACVLCPLSNPRSCSPVCCFCQHSCHQPCLLPSTPTFSTPLPMFSCAGLAVHRTKHSVTNLMMYDDGELVILRRFASPARSSQVWQAKADVCCSQVWQVVAGAAVGAWIGLAPNVGACSGRESGEARVGGGGRPCPVAGKRSMPLLPGPLIPATRNKVFISFDLSIW